MRISDPLIGSQLGDYRIIDLLGRGGMARVYRGYDARLDRYAAVKVIDTYLSGEDEEEYQQRFQREARAIARLHHPCIVGVYQFGQVDSIYYMAMAFIEGRDLGQILRECAQQRRRMPYADIVRVVGDIALALDHAHAEGVIHRDVKPSNIMVKADGHAVLTDFGLALNLPEGSIGNTFGSAHYIAPEQAISSAQAVAQSDQYSLGIVLYQMLTGKVPFDDPSAMSVALKHMNEAPPPLRGRNPDLPANAEAVVLRALEKEPEDRYPTVKALATALAEALKGVRSSQAAVNGGSRTANLAMTDAPTLVSTPLRPPTASAPRRRSRRLWPVAVAGGALAAVLAAVIFAVVPRLKTPLTTPTAEAVGGSVAVPSDTPVPATRSSPVQAVVAAPTQTPTSTVTASPTETQSPSATPSLTPTATSTLTPIPSATASLTATATLRPTETRAPSETPSPTSSAPVIVLAPTRVEDLPVGLYYDVSTLVLVNRTSKVIDMSGIDFVQRLPDGTELTFQSDLWNGAEALEPSNCFQIWTNRYTVLPQPVHCRERQEWRAVSYVRLFWVSERPDATFEVRRGSRVLATCRIDALECGFDPGVREFP